MVSKKYTAAYKLEKVKEYMGLTGVSMAEFAMQNGISDSTFNDWVLKYKRQGTSFCNVTSEIEKLNTLELYDSAPVDIIRKIDNKDLPMSQNVFRVIYNGAIVECDESLLERVMKIIEQW